MINKRLLKMVPDAIPHIRKNVLLQIIGLVANVVVMCSMSALMTLFIQQSIQMSQTIFYFGIACLGVIIKVSCVYLASQQSYLASKTVKPILRSQIYNKVMQLGSRYTTQIESSKVLQIAVEGVEQLEIYFGSFLPQFFYSMMAPVLLFVFVAFIDLKIALVLFVCVPFIPISIVIVQKIAKKLLAKYWNEYLELGDSFLENLQGLNILKIYSADDYKHKAMNKQAERFRVVTMKVLSMQLNSIIIMDLIAYGGAALGIIIALLSFQAGSITILEMFVVMLVSADFFLPLRLLGSFFHVAMNGIAASKNMFALLDLETECKQTKEIDDFSITLQNLSFSYTDQLVLEAIDLEIKPHTFVSIVGKSGCGKSTIAGILMGIHTGYTGSATIGANQIYDMKQASIYEKITCVSTNSYIFKGTIKDNLLMGNAQASTEEMWYALQQVNLSEFVKSEAGLDTIIQEKGSNLSGGQCQRLAIARALLKNSEMYIFDEATSNIDVESEVNILSLIKQLAQTKTIIFISHRLANVVDSDMIYVLKDGHIIEKGNHGCLLSNQNYYSELYHTQQNLENMEGKI